MGKCYSKHNKEKVDKDDVPYSRKGKSKEHDTDENGSGASQLGSPQNRKATPTTSATNKQLTDIGSANTIQQDQEQTEAQNQHNELLQGAGDQSQGTGNQSQSTQNQTQGSGDGLNLVVEPDSLDLVVESGATNYTSPDHFFDPKFLNNISKHIGFTWRSLGVELNFTRHELDNMEKDYPNLQAQCAFHMLSTWQEKLSSNKDARNELAAAMRKADRGDLAEEVENYDNSKFTRNTDRPTTSPSSTQIHVVGDNTQTTHVPPNIIRSPIKQDVPRGNSMLFNESLGEASFEKPEYPFSLQFLRGIAGQMGNDWRDVGTELDFTLPELDNIKQFFPDDQAKCAFKMLNTWQEKLPSGDVRGARDELITALNQANRTDLAELVGKYEGSGIETPKAVSNISPMRKSSFECTSYREMKQKLDDGCRYLILSGSTGGGKTWNIEHYVEEKKKSGDIDGDTWMFAASTKDNLVDSIRLYMEYINSPYTKQSEQNPLKKLKECLVKRKGKHLIVFEDILSKNLYGDIFGAFSSVSNVTVILTTQDSKPYICKDILQVGPMLPDEGKQLFLEILEDSYNVMNEIHLPIKDKDLEALLVEIDYCPSAITLSAYNMAHSRVSIQKYTEDVKQKGKHLDNDELLPAGPLETHKINIKNLKEEMEAAYPNISTSVLQICGFLYKRKIPLFILQLVMEQEKVDEDDITEYIDKLIDKMQRRSLGTLSTDGTEEERFLNTQGLFQIAMRSEMTNTEKCDVIQKLMAALVCYLGKDAPAVFGNVKMMTLLVPHVKSVLDHANAKGLKHDHLGIVLMEIRLYDVLGYIYCVQSSDYELACETYEKCLNRFYKKVLQIDNQKRFDHDIITNLRRQKQTAQCTAPRNVDNSFIKEKAKLLTRKLSDVTREINDDRIVSRLSKEELEENITNKVLTKHDVDIMEKKCARENDKTDRYCEVPKCLQRNRINKEIYLELVESNLAMPLVKASKFFIHELLVSILYSYGRLAFYPSNWPLEKKEMFQNLLKLSMKLCEMLADEGVHILHYVLCERNALLYYLNSKTHFDGTEKSENEFRGDMKQALEKYKQILSDEKYNKEFFQYGILKKTEDDAYHRDVCLKQLAKIHTHILEMDHTEEDIKDALNTLTKMEKIENPDKRFKQAMDKLQAVINSETTSRSNEK